MKKFRCYIGVCMFCWLLPIAGWAQNENDNADVTSETVEDAFQENFFEALRERAIENYDKAIEYLEVCKKLDTTNATVDFQLGRNYASLKKYETAETYFVAAIQKDPENRWFSEALFQVYQAEDKTDEAIELAEELAAKNTKFKENLVLLYARVEAYDKALTLLDELDALYGKSTTRNKQRMRYTTFAKYQQEHQEEGASAYDEAADDGEIEEENPLETMQQEMTELYNSAQYKELLASTNDALESYPSQPFLYYMNGLANEQLGSLQTAVESLENALAFLIDDIVLQKKIYNALASCYKKMGNQKKEQEYLQKAKNI